MILARIKGFVSASGGAMHGFAIGPRTAEEVKVASGYDLGVLKFVSDRPMPSYKWKGPFQILI